MKIGRVRGLLFAMGVLMVLPLGAATQSAYEVPPEGDGPHRRSPEAAEAISKLKSPFCPGQMLEVCPSPYGAALRDTIETLADEGLAADSIVEWMLARYGEDYRALPKREGKALVAWVVPPLAVFVGVLVVGVALRQMRDRRGPRPPSRDDLSPEDQERLVGALAELEQEDEYFPLF